MVKYIDLYGKEKISLLCGDEKKTWLKDAACHPNAETVLIKLNIYEV
jgi:hypothetical protein